MNESPPATNRAGLYKGRAPRWCDGGRFAGELVGCWGSLGEDIVPRLPRPRAMAASILNAPMPLPLSDQCLPPPGAQALPPAVVAAPPQLQVHTARPTTVEHRLAPSWLTPPPPLPTYQPRRPLACRLSRHRRARRPVARPARRLASLLLGMPHCDNAAAHTLPLPPLPLHPHMCATLAPAPSTARPGN